MVAAMALQCWRGDHHPRLGDRRGWGARRVTDARELLRGVLRGEVDVERLTDVGVETKDAGGGVRISTAVQHADEFTLTDLATGLVAQWARGTSLRRWASVILMVDAFQFEEAESEEEQILLDALWTASAGEPVDDAALNLARELARAG